jgi:hypothetical protein
MKAAGLSISGKYFFKDPLAGVFLATGDLPVSLNRDIYEV